MRLALVLGVALAATTAAAYAQQQQGENRVFVYRGGGPHMRMGEADTNHDGWLSRQEASAQADRMFAELDSNHDGKLDDADHDQHVRTFELRTPDLEDGDGPVGEGCTRTVEPANAAPGADRRVTIICERGASNSRTVVVTRDDDSDADAPEAGDNDRQVERHIIVRTPDGPHDGPPPPPGMAPHAPMPPMPPHPPMMMVFFGDTEEFDRNHDGALSRDEFRNQQMRFFEARDGNGDGRVRFEPPPEPPAAPEAPTPPAPPR